MSVYTEFSPSEAESQLAEYLLATVDASWPRNLSFDSALKIFDLQETHLRTIWVLANKDGKGRLSKHELTIAIRLIGWAQAGYAPKEDLLKKKCPLPILRQIPNLESYPSTNTTISNNKAASELRLNDNDNGPFMDVFNQEGPVDGLLDRNQILGIFVSQSSLSFDFLVQVFEIVDVDRREALNSMEFCLAMHILEAFDVGSLWAIMPMIPTEMRARLTSLQSSNVDDYPTITPSQLQNDVHPMCLPTLTSSESRQRRLNGAISLLFSSEAYNSPLSDEQEAALDSIRSELKTNGYLTVEILSMFTRYNIQPVEIAHMWQSIGCNANAIELFIRLIRKRLGSANSSKNKPRHTSRREYLKPPLATTTSTECWPIPTASDPLPRIPSPASSEYSSTSTTDYVDALNITPYGEEQSAEVADTSSSSLNRRPSMDSRNSAIIVPLAAVHHESNVEPQSDESSEVSGTDAGRIRDEIRLLRSQLDEVEQRLSEPLSAAKQHRLQEYYTTEINRLTSTLAQKDNQCRALENLLTDSQATADKHLDHAGDLLNIIDDQRNIIDTQNESLRKMKKELDETKDAMAELTSTSTSPTMRILFLRASLRASETEIHRAKAETEELRSTVTARDAQISELCSQSACVSTRACHVDSDSDVRQDLKSAPMETLLADMGNLKTQIHDMRRIMEHVIGPAEFEATSRKVRWGDTMCTQVGEQPIGIPGLNGASQISVKGILKNNHQRTSESHVTVNSVEVSQYMPRYMGSSGKLHKDLISDAGVIDPPQGISNQELIQISESHSIPRFQEKTIGPQKNKSESNGDAGPSLPSSPPMPKDPVNARHTLMSIKTRTVENLTSSAASELAAPPESPPAYPENSSYTAFSTGSNPKEDLYLRAMKAVNTKPPMSTSPLKFTKKNQKKSTSSSHGQDFALPAIPENPLISGTSIVSTAVAAGKVSSHQTVSVEVSLPLELEAQLPDQQSPTASRKFSKKNSRLQEWYEQQIGRLMAKCENANKAARTARQETQVHHEAARRATSEVDALRRIVKSQKDRMDCLAIEVACHGRRGELIINNPDDDDVRDMGRLGLPSYEQSLGDYSC